MALPIETTPKFATRLILFFLRDELVEEVLGDLKEKFHDDLQNGSVFKARLNYWYQALNYMRPFALKKAPQLNTINYNMYRSYFKIGYRNIVRNKGYAAINIGGLAIGMAVVILISLWIQDELSYNGYHKNHDHIALVMEQRTINGNVETQPIIPIPLEDELRSIYGSNFKHLVTSFWPQEQILSSGNKKFTKTGNYMGDEVIQLFSLNMLKGTNNSLSDPHSIILSKSTADVFFSNGEAIGKSMQINNDMDVKVTGIYEDIPKTSSLHGLSFIAPWDLFVSSNEWVKASRDQNDWDMASFQLYIQLAENMKMEEVSDKIKNITYDHVGEFKKSYDPRLFLHPMNDWHLRSNWKNGIHSGGLIQFVWLFGAIGMFVLILACINFMNLSTAQSEKRSKEVGIRKSLGSLRGQLISQYLTESFLVAVVSFVLAVILVLAAMPYFNNLSDKQLVFPFDSLLFWSASIGFIVFTGLLAGSYPALYLSSFHPVQVLKGTFKKGRSSTNFRRALVVVQFTVSIALIIGTLAVQRQIQHTKDRPMGYDLTNTIMIWSNTPDFKGKFELLRNELKQRNAIIEMSEATSPLTAVFSNSGNIAWEGKDPNLRINFATIRVTYDFGTTAGWEVVEGRDFSSEYASDSSAFIINQTAASYMGLDQPIDKLITWGEGEKANKYRIVGVINDILMESPSNSIRPTLYSIGRGDMDCMSIKLNPRLSTEKSLASVKEVFSELLPNMPFDYRFADHEHGLKFAAEERIEKLSFVFALIAILISCLGLFGLASFVVEQRAKEMGIRKVLGASVFGIWKMISLDFVVLVLFSCLIAIPISNYILAGWLSNFEYRTDVAWWVFIAAGFGAICITILTVSFHALKTARSNPVESLMSN